jgi:cytochrome c oxidase subunit 4
MAHENDHSLKPYVFVLVALLALTALTVFVATIDFGAANDMVALGIALVKASLVVMFFMHVRGATPVIKLAAVGGFFWLAIFFAIILSDFGFRLVLGTAWSP